MERDKAVALVNEWVRDYHRYLKDGGGAAGVHAAAKEALIARIRAALSQSTTEIDDKVVPLKRPKKPAKKPRVVAE